MTARTTTLRGASAGRYYVEAGLDYYLDGDEPAGVWHGRGAAQLSLAGVVDEDVFLALMEGCHPTTGVLLGTAHTERTVRGFDVTCSAPKSVSVLFALGSPEVRAEVLAAHDAAVAAMVEWVDAQAHCRYRVGGQVGVYDAEGVVAAVFRQHTSRALDPQVHSHVVIVNRVLAGDGRWLALDARTIKQDQQALSRLYHAGLRAELTDRLGVRWRPVERGLAEMADIPTKVLDAYSRRTDAVEARLEDKLERFETALERVPTPRERWRLEREAVVESRPSASIVDRWELEREWHERLATLGMAPDQLHAGLGYDHPRGGPSADTATRMVDGALGALAERQSTWRRAELVRELAGAVPAEVGGPAGLVVGWVDRVADAVIAERLVALSAPVLEGVPVRRDGRPITEAATDRLFTTPEILAQEERIMALAERRLHAGGHDRRLMSADGLEAPQQALAEAVAGDRELVLAVGPAGTGKTTALRPAVEQLRAEGRAVFGTAPSASAAEVLATETGIDADTVDKLLTEHGLQRPPDHRFALPPGATVIVDEAAMVPTGRLSQLFDLAEERSWRLALVGDPLQFAAVGRSGMFGHLADIHGAIELGRVHRFDQAWERDASLQLRRGDPAALDTYEEHGRLHGGTPRRMQAAVIDAWWTATTRGETTSLVAPTNASVVELNQAAQQRRLDAGHLDPSRGVLTVGAYRLHVGDVVTTRRNARDLLTDHGAMVKNRDRWSVEALGSDGSLHLQGRSGRVSLPEEYVQEHVQLAYAETSHASQGRTVDRSFLYLDAPTAGSGIYVPMTRGRLSNEAFIVVHGEENAADVLAESLSRRWIDRPAVQVAAETRSTPAEPANPAPTDDRLLDRETLRALFDRSANLEATLARLRSDLNSAQQHLDTIDRDHHALTARLNTAEEQVQTAQATLARLDRPIIRLRHRDEITAARHVVTHQPALIAANRSQLGELEKQRRGATVQLSQARSAAGGSPALEQEQHAVNARLGHDLAARRDLNSAQLNLAVVTRLGPRPHGAASATLWRDTAARLDQHLTAHGTMPQEYRALDLGSATTSHERQVAHDLHRLDRTRALQHERQIEGPHHGFGLGL